MDPMKFTRLPRQTFQKYVLIHHARGVVQHDFVLVLLLDLSNSGPQPVVAVLRKQFLPLGIFDVLLDCSAAQLPP